MFLSLINFFLCLNRKKNINHHRFVKPVFFFFFFFFFEALEQFVLFVLTLNFIMILIIFFFNYKTIENMEESNTIEKYSTYEDYRIN